MSMLMQGATLQVQTYKIMKQAAGDSMTLSDYLTHCRMHITHQPPAPSPQDEASSKRQRRCLILYSTRHLHWQMCMVRTLPF